MSDKTSRIGILSRRKHFLEEIDRLQTREAELLTAYREQAQEHSLELKDAVQDEVKKVTAQFQQYIVDQSNIRRVSLEAALDNQSGEYNDYKSYEHQVTAVFDKYNNKTDLGSATIRAIVDLRTAFISGEEVAISSDNKSFVDWAEDFLKMNSFQSKIFIPAVKNSEMAGHTLIVMDVVRGDENNRASDQKLLRMSNGEPFVRLKRIPHTKKVKYRPVYSGEFEENFDGLEIKRSDALTSESEITRAVTTLTQRARTALGYFPLPYTDYTYVRVGGDDTPGEDPTSRVGSVLQYIDNYDRCLKDIRLLNHITARITPVFKTEDPTYSAALQDKLEEDGWKIGDAVVGNIEFKYATSETGPLNSLTSELVALIKSITGVTGIPIHWLGYTEILSNRSTAETLYDLIKNATINDRSKWQDELYDMILQAQYLYIDAGGTKISEVNRDFKVTIPLIDFSSFFQRIQGLSLAYKDYAISTQTYRSMLPGLDPTKEARLVDDEIKDDESDLRLRLDRTVKTIIDDQTRETEPNPSRSEQERSRQGR